MYIDVFPDRIDFLKIANGKTLSFCQACEDVVIEVRFRALDHVTAISATGPFAGLAGIETIHGLSNPTYPMNSLLISLAGTTWNGGDTASIYISAC